MTALLVLIVVAAPLTNENFELGTNQWSVFSISAGHQSARVPEARHSGLFGVRMTDTIALPEAVSGPILNWQVPQDAGASPVYVRFWGRISGVDPASTGVQFANIHRLSPPPSVLGLGYYESGQTNFDVEGNGFDDAGTVRNWSAGLRTPYLGQWELYEFRSKNGPDNRVEYAVARDGVVLAEGVTPLTSVGRLSYVEVGLVYSYDDRFAGTFDVDDLRSDFSPMASRLAISAPPAWRVGECVPVSVRPVDSWDGGLAAAATSDMVTVTTFLGATTVYSDLSCSVLGEPQLAAGSVGVTFSMRGTAPGTNVIVAANTTDLITTSVRVQLVADDGGVDAGRRDAGSPDAGGPDAGTIDAGGSDAGTTDAGPTDAGGSDAGTPDAGATDAGTQDGGPTDSDAGRMDAGRVDAGTVDGLDGGPAAPAGYAVGCGCASQTWFGPAAALVALLTRRRFRCASVRAGA